MKQVLYVVLLPDVQSQLTPEFWQAMAFQHLPSQPACVLDEQGLFTRLSCCQGEWLLILIGYPPVTVELSWLENQLDRLLLTQPALTLTLAVYDWGKEITPACQARKLAQLIQQPEWHRQCLPCDVEFDPQWSALPAYQYRLLLCNGRRCARRNSARLWKQLADLLAQEGLLETSQGALLVKTHCQYPCNHGPVLSLYPGEYWYSIRQITDVQKLVTQHIKAGKPVTQLLLNLPLLSAEVK